jgi:hypothetical protein
MTLHAPQTTTSVRRYVPGLASIVDGARTSALTETLTETLTGDEPIGEKLLSAALLLAIGVGVSFLIGHWRRRLLNQLDP